jgi:hypothetical protein
MLYLIESDHIQIALAREIDLLLCPIADTTDMATETSLFAPRYFITYKYMPSHNTTHSKSLHYAELKKIFLYIVDPSPLQSVSSPINSSHSHAIFAHGKTII